MVFATRAGVRLERRHGTCSTRPAKRRSTERPEVRSDTSSHARGAVPASALSRSDPTGQWPGSGATSAGVVFLKR